MAVRGDAARQGQGVQQLLDAGDRLQLALQNQGRAGPHRLEELVGQRTPKAALDGGTEGCAVLAKAEGEGLVGCRRKTRLDQAFAEHPSEDQLAVDQHTVAIEDDEIAHARVFSMGQRFAAYMAPDIVTCHPWRGAASCPVSAQISGSCSAKCRFSIASMPRRGRALPQSNTRHPTTIRRRSCAPG